MNVSRLSYAVVEANFDWTVVEVEDDSGAVGVGECFFAPGLPAILDELATLVVGRDPRQITPLVERLYRAASGAGSTAGIMLNAISGIDAALWDLAARSLDVPLWQLLGGRYHDSVRVYADCHSSEALHSLDPLLRPRRASWTNASGDVESTGATLFDPDPAAGAVDLAQVSKQAAHAVSLGFDAVKFDVDVPGLLPSGLGARHLPPSAASFLPDYVGAIRAGAGTDPDIALDCHWRYDMATARMICDLCADAGLMWLEDPLAPDDVAGLVELARSTAVPLATGENLGRWVGFAELIDSRGVAVVTPDLAKVGGLREARLIAETAAVRGLTIAPHNIAGPIGTAFAAQVSSTFPNLLALEYHALSVPFFDELIREGPLIVNGRIVMTDRPGIGVTLNREAVRANAKPGVPVFGAHDG